MQQSTNVARTQTKHLFILYIVRTSQRGTFNAPVINELTCLSLISSYTYCQYCSWLRRVNGQPCHISWSQKNLLFPEVTLEQCKFLAMFLCKDTDILICKYTSASCRRLIALRWPYDLTILILTILLNLLTHKSTTIVAEVMTYRCRCQRHRTEKQYRCDSSPVRRCWGSSCSRRDCCEVLSSCPGLSRSARALALAAWCPPPPPCWLMTSHRNRKQSASVRSRRRRLTLQVRYSWREKTRCPWWRQTHYSAARPPTTHQATVTTISAN